MCTFYYSHLGMLSSCPSVFSRKRRDYLLLTEVHIYDLQVMSRHPKGGEGHGAKVRYMTQVKARPPTFVVFVSGQGKLDDTELRFLASALREDFGLVGIPIRVFQRCSKDQRTVE